MADDLIINNEATLIKAIELMRLIGKDTQLYEVKTSRRALPRDITETISAFSNGSGGYIICGVSEKDGFTPIPGFDAQSVHDALLEACNTKMTPPVRPDVWILPFEGSTILVAHIKELLPVDKPCYITASDKYHGSFIRTGDGDQRLSEYEVDRLLDEHRQPRFDGEIVPEATQNDLDITLVNSLLSRERAIHPRNFAQLSDEDALAQLNILKYDNAGILRPTLAGILALGTHPQHFYPRLNVSFAAYPGTDKSEVSASGSRLLDSATLIGPIPYLVADAISVVRKNMRIGAVIDSAFRRDVPDYPIIALREAIANALMHRDYSPLAQGTPVHIDLFADRIEITNPGGLYGTMTIDKLGRQHGSSSRNQFLASILESTPAEDGGFVVENRGSGFRAIESELASALMPEPAIKNTVSFFSLTFLKRRETVQEHTYTAGTTVRTVVLDMLSRKESITAAEVVIASGKSKTTVNKYLNEMINRDRTIEAIGSSSTKRRYRLTTRHN